MKKILFLLLFPCLAMAQYQGNANQKITLGEQTTADGLVWRGLRADTTSKIVPFSDTSAYIILDTVEKTLWLYKAGQIPKWQQVGGSTLDTATMLLPYYRAGRNTIIQAADVPTLNQNTTGSAATLTTGRTIQTNLASTSTATFNGSANITPGVTGVLPVANGGTNTSSFTAGSVIFAGASGTSLTQDNSNLFFDDANNRLGIGTSTPGTLLEVNKALGAGDQRVAAFLNSDGNAFIVMGTSIFTSRGALFIYDDTNNYGAFRILGDAAGTGINVQDGGNLGVGTTTPAVQFHTTGGVRFATFAGGGTTTLSVDNNGDLARTSSIELKKDVTPINYGLNEILQINPINFNWIDENKFGNENENGFIAEDVMSVIPNVVAADTHGLFMDYTKLIPILTKAIQQQQALIKALEQRILTLENK